MLEHEVLAARYLKILDEHLELRDVSYNKMSAEVKQTEVEDGGLHPVFGLRVSGDGSVARNDEGWLSTSIALAVDIEVDRGVISGEVEGTYRFPEHLVNDVNPIGLVAYANDQAITTLLPYLREVVQNLASRVLRAQIIMPHFVTSDVVFPLPTESDMEEMGYIQAEGGYLTPQKKPE
ncbi:MAG: hypothetical protein ACTJE8_00030 [Corynebacterium sp.]|uniref:hypothetical protein n=1 Tax=Corynebacterium casei TaxID=160386 RepID=UPI003F8F7551